MKDYNINRQDAAKIIGISLRTLDRYVLKGTLNYKKIKGRVLFSNEDLNQLKSENNTESISGIKTDFDFKKKQKTSETFQVFKSKEDNTDTDLVSITKTGLERDIYKKLYEVNLVELKEKQEKLEKINFKLGEVLAKQDLPLLETKRSKEEIFLLNGKINSSKELINKLKEELSFQKFIKTVFVVMLILTFSILFFWYFYNFKV